MATYIQSPTIIKAEGNKPKLIEEFIGAVNSGTNQLSLNDKSSKLGRTWTNSRVLRIH